jgi:Mg-chelatase subunit ChlD
VANQADPGGTLRRVAQALWGHPLRVATLSGAVDADTRAVLQGHTAGEQVLHLPPGSLEAAGPDGPLALASHAAAHGRFGGEPQARAGLKPVQQALLGVLEDARVEWLAMQELPGLRAVWWPFHAGLVATRGGSFEDLLARLSANLLDPAHEDPHPWLARVRSLFFEADGRTLALRTPAAVRQAASVLGNDIGQMRLPFNPRTYRVHARYRDDNSHLWLPDESLPPSGTPLEGGEGCAPPDDPATEPPPPASSGSSGAGRESRQSSGQADAVYPEWDHRIARYRPNWCHVYTSEPARAAAATADTAQLTAVARRLAQGLRLLQGRPERASGRTATGEDLHPVALVEGHVDLRSGRTPDHRVYQRLWRPRHPLAVLMLVDASASTARQGGPSLDGAVLARMRQSAVAAAGALQLLGHRTALWAFSSQGRHRIDMPCLKAWDAPLDAQGMAHLHSAGSTRLGAALRHALQLSAADARRHPGWRRVIVLVTDGELHDIDVHDPAYLPADLRRAGQEAAAMGVAVRSLVFHPGDALTLDAALGRGHSRSLGNPAGLQVPLARLLADLA